MARKTRIETLQRLASHTEADNARRLAERLRALDTFQHGIEPLRTGGMPGNHASAKAPREVPGATSIDEVFVEAEADDDFGVARLELLYAVNGGVEKSVRLAAGAGGLEVEHGLHGIRFLAQEGSKRRRDARLQEPLQR